MQARLQSGRAHDCVSDCDAALALDKENVKFLLRRAAALVATNQRERACLDYQRVLSLAPENPVAREYLEKTGEAGETALEQASRMQWHCPCSRW